MSSIYILYDYTIIEYSFKDKNTIFPYQLKNFFSTSNSTQSHPESYYSPHDSSFSSFFLDCNTDVGFCHYVLKCIFTGTFIR